MLQCGGMNKGFARRGSIGLLMPHLQQLVRHLPRATRKLTVVGHSMGSAHAQIFAVCLSEMLQEPPTVELILLGPVRQPSLVVS